MGKVSPVGATTAETGCKLGKAVAAVPDHCFPDFAMGCRILDTHGKTEAPAEISAARNAQTNRSHSPATTRGVD